MCTLCAVQEVGGATPLTLYTLPWPAWTRQPRDAQLTCLEADPTASSHRTQLTTESPLWVGAWWVGFLGAGATAVLIAVPILGYPRQLPGGCPRCARPSGPCGPPRRQESPDGPVCWVFCPAGRGRPTASPPPGPPGGVSWGVHPFSPLWSQGALLALPHLVSPWTPVAGAGPPGQPVAPASR